MKKLLISCILSIALIVSLVACSDSSTGTVGQNETEAPIGESPDVKASGSKPEDVKKEVSTKPSDAPIAEATKGPAKENSNIDFKCDVGRLVYTKHNVTEDYEGNPAILIYFDYTNLSDETSSASSAFSAKPFQNGIECTTAVVLEDTKGYNNSIKEVKKGSTLSVCFAYALEDTTSDIELEVTEFFPVNNEKATQILKLN